VETRSILIVSSFKIVLKVLTSKHLTLHKQKLSHKFEKSLNGEIQSWSFGAVGLQLSVISFFLPAPLLPHLPLATCHLPLKKLPCSLN
jgi:hypothetical protein